ncbi:MAG: hypothetical protein QM831_38395 [Kofleriaceae bacterium]
MELLVFAGGLIVCTVGAIAGGGYLIGRRRELCPACNRKKLKVTGGVLASARVPEGNGWSTEYTCDACSAKFARWKNGDLIPKEAWDRGVREAPPVATIVRD